MRIIVFINVIRIFLFLTSIIAFACHATQCILLAAYQRQMFISDWLTAGHWQYMAWYITLGLSLLSATAIGLHACCCNRGHILRGDKILSIVNIVPLFFTILAVTGFGGQEPWTDGVIEFTRPAHGFINYCSKLDTEHDKLFPLLYHRCIMVDGTWIFAIATCAFWIILATCTCVAKPIKRHSVGRLPTEMKWTDYTTTHTSHHAAVAPAHPKAQYDYTAYDNPSTMRKPEKSMESMNTIQLPIHADPDYMMRYQAYPSMSPHAIDDQYQSRFRSPSVHTYYPSQAPTPVMPKAPSLVDQTWKLEYVPPIPIHTFEVPTSALQHPQTPAMSTTPTTPVSVRQPLPVSYDFHPNPPYEHIDSDRRSSATSLLFHPPPPFTPPTDTKHAVSE